MDGNKKAGAQADPLVQGTALNPEPQAKLSLRIGAIDIEYEGNDPEQFRKDVDAAFSAILDPIRKAFGK